MEQIGKTDRKPFAHMKKPCSMPTEQSGTSGTKPNLLTPANKFVCVINIIIFFGNYHQKIVIKKEQIKKPRISAGSAKPLRVRF